MIDHWCRHVMNEAVVEKVKSLPYKDLDVLEVSGSEWQAFGFKSYENVQYPAFDICKNTTDKLYDLIIAEQVFEHIEDPMAAAKNIFRMLRKDGMLLITTPFLIKYHPSPLDLYRWSKDGLQVLLEKQGFKNVETYSWGNKDCLIGNLEVWPYYDPKKHSLENQEDYPVVVWGFAYRKRSNARAILTNF